MSEQERLTAERLAELGRIAEAATPGPWGIPGENVFRVVSAAARWHRAKAAYRAACEVYEQARAEYEAAERELEYAAAEVSRVGGLES